MAHIRLDKFLADSGAGTRSQVKEIIKKGRVMVNDTVAKKGDIKVDTSVDVVLMDGMSMSHEDFEYFMLNKPQGVVSATTDLEHKTVIELIKDAKRRDLFPVGRLDKDTEGFLLITNDGPLANSLLAPGKHVDKVYEAKITGVVTPDDVISFEKGIDIGDDKLTAPAKLEIIKSIEFENGDEGSLVKVTITEGRYHQIKRMFHALGKEVVYLKRLSMGPLCLDEDLSVGEYRRLTDEEVTLLKEVHKNG